MKFTEPGTGRFHWILAKKCYCQSKLARNYHHWEKSLELLCQPFTLIPESHKIWEQNLASGQPTQLVSTGCRQVSPASGPQSTCPKPFPKLTILSAQRGRSSETAAIQVRKVDPGTQGPLWPCLSTVLQKRPSLLNCMHPPHKRCHLLIVTQTPLHIPTATESAVLSPLWLPSLQISRSQRSPSIISSFKEAFQIRPSPI